MRIVVIAGLVGGCGGAAAPCEVNGDCAAGQICADHACIASDAAPIGDAGDAAPACAPNHDGVIERDEVLIIVPASVTFRTSGEAPVDLAGSQWDFAPALAGDHDTAFTTAPLAGQWFADRFAGGQFVTPLAGAGSDGLLGVYAAATNHVQILGAASTMPGLQQTVLAYAPPVDALVFPLHEGQHWQGQSTVSGTAQGVPALFADTWTQDVDARGEVTTPYGAFPVLRVRLRLVRTIGALVTTTTSYAFVAECFGTVATVTSRPNDLAQPPAIAAEVRRLAP